MHERKRDQHCSATSDRTGTKIKILLIASFSLCGRAVRNNGARNRTGSSTRSRGRLWPGNCHTWPWADEAESARKGDLTPSLFGPWAPIPSEAPLKDKKVNIAISVAALVIVWLTPGTIRTIQPIIYATIFQIFRMFMKLVDVDPGPSANIDRDAATKHNNKRFFRSFALVLGTFAVSLGLTYWIPNMIFETFRVQVPVWYLLNQEIFVSAIVGGCLSYLTCFYR